MSTAVRDNKAIFSGVEFEAWARKERLIPAERCLIGHYLAKTGKTLEAGCGGGKILLAMKEMGFTSLYGFDYVLEFVERAKKKDATNSITFEVGNAVSLAYREHSFDQVIYLQQVICFIEDEGSRLQALREAHRVLRPGGIALFSFLCFEARRRSLIYAPYLWYLTLFRKLTRSKRSIQNSPWLKLGGKLNLRALLDRGPYVFWYELDEIFHCLRETGFEVVAVGSTKQINENRMLESPEHLAQDGIEGMLYLVARTRESPPQNSP